VLHAASLQTALLKPHPSSLPKKPRIWEIDFLRGICIVLVVFDHFMFAWISVYQMSGGFLYTMGNPVIEEMMYTALWYWDWQVRIITRYTVIFLFLFLSGISSTFSRGQAKRFLDLAVGASLVTLATVLIMPDFPIVFGILHIMAFNVLFYFLYDLWAKKVIQPDKSCLRKILYLLPLFAVGVFLVVLGFQIPFYEVVSWGRGYGIEGWRSIEIQGDFLWPLIFMSLAFVVYLIQFARIKFLSPLLEKKCKQPKRAILISHFAAGVVIGTGLILLLTLYPIEPIRRETFDLFFGIVQGTRHFGADFYGVMPFTGVFLLGVVTGQLVYAKKNSLLPKLDKSYNRAFCFSGKYAFLIYLAHLVIIMPLVLGAALLAGYQLF